jgi:transcriptional regulator of arginine metabolism
MKKRRHAKILELINSHDIETQEELQAFLLKNGYEVTQATISRDIKELRLVKDLSDKGRYIYSTGKKNNENARRTGGIFGESIMLNTLKILFALNAFQVWLLPYALQLTQWNGQAS